MLENKIKILIVDDNQDFSCKLEKRLNDDESLEVSGLACNGEEALQMTTALNPDIILLDVVMPHLDGIGVLERLNRMKLDKRPICIMISEIGSEGVITKCLNLGAKYYIIKPFDYELLIQRIKELKVKKNIKINNNFIVNESNTDYIPSIYTEEDIELLISRLLHELGIPAHLKGYQFLLEAIMMVSKDMKEIDYMTKGLYPQIARKYDSDGDKVERTIRHAITVAWENMDKEYLSEIFGYRINITRKPSNSEFIAMIADKIRLETKLKSKIAM